MDFSQRLVPLALIALASPVAAMPSETMIVKILYTHGILATLSWALFFPLGVVLVRVISKNARNIHWMWQTFTFLVFTAAWGLGVWLATELNLWKTWNGHAIIGTIVFGLMWMMPILGVLHHYEYIGGKRAYNWAWVHVWLGRILITVGTINGGLGLQLSYSKVPKPATKQGQIAYGVVAAIVWLIWVGVSILAVIRSHGDVNVGSESGPKVQGVGLRKDSDATAIGAADIDKEKGTEEETHLNGQGTATSDAAATGVTTSNIDAAATTTGVTGGADSAVATTSLDGAGGAGNITTATVTGAAQGSAGAETTTYYTTTYTSTTSGAGEDIVHGGNHFNTRMANVIDPAVNARSDTGMFG